VLRLFLKLYLLLMLPATAAFVLLMYVTDQVMAQIHAEQHRARAAGALRARRAHHQRHARARLAAGA
jgi:hypothetical protein